MSNIHEKNFNKNVIEVYTEEPGFTGYKGLEWNKLDSIEDILTGSNGSNSYLSGILENTTSIDGKIFVTGDPYPAGVQGTIVFQADLTSQFDNVEISGTAGSNINELTNTISNNFTAYNSIELLYDGSSNNTGVFYKTNGVTTRVINMQYDLSNNLTGVVKIDY